MVIRELLILLPLVGCATPLVNQPIVHQDADKERSGSAHSVSVGATATNKYFFHGFFQENKGPILQPWIEVGTVLREGGDGKPSVGLTLGSWNSVHGNSSGASGTAPNWYESDFYVGFSLGITDRIDVGTNFTVLTSPNSAFGTQQLLDFSVSYDDSDCWNLSPRVMLAFELEGANDLGSDLGMYLELGVSKSFTVSVASTLPVDVSIPVTAGLSVGDYYENASGDDDLLGFVDVGVDLSMPIACLPKRFGALQLHAGVHALFLGETLKTINRGEDFETIGSVGFSLNW